jgi:hypothetical protein
MLKLLTAAVLTLVLTGCASLNNVQSEVTTFGPWPADRKPATFTFERLPSQQAHPEHQQELEDAARGAVESAGFRAAPDASTAEYLMQVGARVSVNDPWIYNEPLFWHGGWRYGYGYGRWARPGWGPGPYWGGRGFWGPGYGPMYDSPTYDREVALLIRDRKTGQLLYEARANSSGYSSGVSTVLPAMFEAAMKDFPNVSPKPRNVTTQISKTP